MAATSPGCRPGRRQLRPRPVRAWVLEAATLLLLLVQLHGCGATGSSALDLASKRNKPVIVVLGTAGSGTRTVHQILAAAGVWMHPFTNKEYDSKLFITRIKHTPPFGMPEPKNRHRRPANAPTSTPLWQYGMMWETRHTPAFYEPGQLSANVRTKLQRAHVWVAAEFLADVPDDAPVWGWKEPQAIYTLPFLTQVFPNLRVIHQTRDGRDVALSNLNSTSRRMTQPYQRHYVKLISGQAFSDAELTTPRFSVAAGHTWSAVNGNARRWMLAAHGMGLQGSYSLARLEDFCGSRVHDTIRTLLGNAGVAFNDSVVATAAATINSTKCQTARWQAAASSNDTQLVSAMRALDADIGDTLELFDYDAAAAPGWLDDAALADRLMQLPVVKSAAAGSSKAPRQPLVVAFVQPREERLLHNWLAWLQGSGTNVSHVLVVMQQDTSTSVESAGAAAAAAMDGATAGFSMSGVVQGFKGPSVLGLPVASSNSSRGLQQQLHVLYELNKMQIAVLLSDIRTLWVQDAAAHVQAATTAAAAAQAGCCDIAVSLGVFPFDVTTPAGTTAGHPLLQQTLAAANTAASDTGHVGLAFFNTTAAAAHVLRLQLWQQHHRSPLSSFKGTDAHGPRGQSAALEAAPSSLLGALHHTLLMENLRFERVTISAGRALMGVKATTAPNPLKVLVLPPEQLQQSCRKPDSSESSVVAVDCSQLSRQQQVLAQRDRAQGHHQQLQQSGLIAEPGMRAAGLWKGPAEVPVAPTH